jgi:hypothetical protein
VIHKSAYSILSSQMRMLCLLGDAWQWWFELHGGVEDEPEDRNHDNGDELRSGMRTVAEKTRKGEGDKHNDG